ncbi:MAG: hypothetical protein HC895_08820 [Leptolyngbyaceae cyanobacterium SM1_3_5]|nr:hypothetical protein [Leptolyngbyaceae cyanobacterium SM1_3_5]
MAIVLGVLAALAIISAVGSASKVARQRSGQSVNNSAAEVVQKSIEVQKAIETPALPLAELSEPQSIESSAETRSIESPEPQSIEPQPTQSEPVAESGSVAKELVDSILERMPDVPMSASLLVSEVVNPESNDLGVQLDRPNYPIDPRETLPTHHGNNLIDEISQLDQGDRIRQLAW